MDRILVKSGTRALCVVALRDLDRDGSKNEPHLARAEGGAVGGGWLLRERFVLARGLHPWADNVHHRPSGTKLNGPLIECRGSRHRTIGVNSALNCS